MNTIDLIQRTPEWLAWRAQGISASDAATILGLSPYKTPWRLWAEKTGLLLPEDLSGNFFVQRGNALEDAARQDFEERHNTFVLPLCGESDAHPIIRASFDGLDDDGRPVEIKVPSGKTYCEVLELGVESDAYKLYWPQVQAQLYVADAPQAWLVFFQSPGVHTEFQVARDEAFILERLVPGCLAFWERVAKKKEPARDPERDIYTPCGEAIETWTKLSGAYRKLAADKAKLEARVKQLKAGMDGIEADLVAMMGDFVLAETAGLRVLRYAVAGSIDYRDALSDLVPELDPARLEHYRR
ncbi:MAG: YqaJ viral recombinase family protein, partial [Chromatiaceae bacterium]